MRSSIGGFCFFLGLFIVGQGLLAQDCNPGGNDDAVQDELGGQEGFAFDLTRFSAVGQPHFIDTGDLNSDGIPDVVTANKAAQSAYTLFLGQSDGSLERHAWVPLPVVAVAALDMNGDGVDDLVFRHGDGKLLVLLNRGEGDFEDPMTAGAVEGFAFQLEKADVDGDGQGDVLAVDTNIDRFTVCFGDGHGGFAESHVLEVGQNSREVDAGDLDADGDVDLVVANLVSSDLSLLFQEEPRQFAPAVSVPVSGGPLDVALADVDLDGDLDVVTVNDGTDDAALLLNPGDGAIASPARRFPLEHSPLAVQVRDLDRDGLVDLVTTTGAFFGTTFEDGVAILRGRGDGTFLEPQHFPVSGNPRGLETVDLDADGDLDLVTGLRNGFSVAVLLNQTALALDDAPDPPVIPVEGQPQEQPIEEPLANPTFRLEIPAETILCGVFVVASGDRGAREERELKTLVRLRAGTVMLSTEEETFTAELFEEVVFGPERLTAEPVLLEGTRMGTFRVVRIPGPPGEKNTVTTFRFTYSQSFLLPDGRLLELEVVAPLTFDACGEKPRRETQTLPEGFFAVLKGREALWAKLDGESLLRYGSCTYDALPRWEIEVDLEDGTVLALEERFEEAASFNDTGPASLVRADVTFGPVSSGDGRRVVTDYFDLVYSASRHNTAVDYWVVLDPPLEIDAAFLDSPARVHGLEIRAPESRVGPSREASAAYLGADFEVLSRPRVTRFERASLGEALFVRGDAGGDGMLDVADAIRVLRYLFEREDVPCLSTADANDDGRVNIVDAIAVVSALFARGGDLPAPFPGCGADPTEDGLSCRSAAPCP